jgi:hypothetical protein
VLVATRHGSSGPPAAREEDLGLGTRWAKVTPGVQLVSAQWVNMGLSLLVLFR